MGASSTFYSESDSDTAADELSTSPSVRELDKELAVSSGDLIRLCPTHGCQAAGGFPSLVVSHRLSITRPMTHTEGGTHMIVSCLLETASI